MSEPLKIVCTMHDYGNEVSLALADQSGPTRAEVRIPVGANNLDVVQKVLTAVNELLLKAENAS
jgi:hypothetical protein